MKQLNDVLGFDNLKIYQDNKYFLFSLDSIILACYSTIRLRDNVIVDFCTGNGIVPLILSKRTKKNLIGIEIQKKVFELACDSVLYNNLEKQISILNADIKDFSNKNLNYADLLLCNPPYFKVSSEKNLNISYEKMIARHEIMINLSDLCKCAKKVLKDNGTFCLIHRTDRLIEIIEELKNNNLEPKKIKFIYENLNKNSFMFLIESQKNGKKGLKIEKPLILYNPDGSITKEYNDIQNGVIL